MEKETFVQDKAYLVCRNNLFALLLSQLSQFLESIQTGIEFHPCCARTCVSCTS